jgi:hypothetical protein
MNEDTLIYKFDIGDLVQIQYHPYIRKHAIGEQGIVTDYQFSNYRITAEGRPEITGIRYVIYISQMNIEIPITGKALKLICKGSHNEMD